MRSEVTPEVRAAAEAVHEAVRAKRAIRCECGKCVWCHQSKLWKDASTLADFVISLIDADARGDDGESVRVPVELVQRMPGFIEDAKLLYEQEDDDEDLIEMADETRQQLRDLLAALGKEVG